MARVLPGLIGRAGPLLASLLALGVAAPAAGSTAQGDAAWASRALGAQEGRPQIEQIRGIVHAYEEAMAAEPENLEARWKLLRALHFEGDFAAVEGEDQRRAFDRGREVAEEGLDRLAARIGHDVRREEADPALLEASLAESHVSVSDAARLYFWAAIHWGSWSRRVGLLGAVREGVADRLYRYARVAAALEPGYDEGGPLRLLGRLHAKLPRIPFLTDWVDRSRAIPLIERAVEIAPDDPGNRLLLALTLLDLDEARRDEAVELLRGLERRDPRPEMRIEDLSTLREAREVLVELGETR